MIRFFDPKQLLRVSCILRYYYIKCYSIIFENASLRCFIVTLLYIYKKNYCIVRRSFYRALQKFQYINIFCLFLMTHIGTKFWCVFKLHRSDLHAKTSHRIQYILFYRTLQDFEYIYGTFLMTQIGTKFWYLFKLHRSDLHTKISHRIQHMFFYRALQKFECINVCCFLLKVQHHHEISICFKNTHICSIY